MAKKGFFILADISDYTEFLTRSGLGHAQDTLQNLFDVQLAHNTTCTCRACQNMSRLDLKMVIHYGEYAIQKLGDREELLGADVIVPHRMLKNQVIEQTGIESYALFSKAAAEASMLSQLAYPLVSHSEVYEHIGEVKMQVLDLRKVWERQQDKQRFVVTPEEAWLNLEWDAPYPLFSVWEYLTTIRLEQQYAGYDLVERTDSLGGASKPTPPITAPAAKPIFSTGSWTGNLSNTFPSNRT